MKAPDATLKSRMRSQRVITVVEYDHVKKRALVRCYPSSKPRWVKLSRVQVAA